MKKIVLIALVSVAAIGAQAALITNEGASAPTGSLAQNLSEGAAGGNRELSYRTTLIHSMVGQSFTANQTAVARGISLFMVTPENFATAYNSDTFRLKVFAGDESTGNTSALGTYSYDATALGDAVDDVWLRFDLGSGVAMTSGQTYSFMIIMPQLDADHRINFRRARNLSEDVYTGGSEQRAANLYDIANWETDPWDDALPIGSSAVADSGDLLFSVDTIPEPATLGLVAMVGGALFGIRRFFIV